LSAGDILLLQFSGHTNSAAWVLLDSRSAPKPTNSERRLSSAVRLLGTLVTLRQTEPTPFPAPACTIYLVPGLAWRIAARFGAPAPEPVERHEARLTTLLSIFTSQIGELLDWYSASIPSKECARLSRGAVEGRAGLMLSCAKHQMGQLTFSPARTACTLG
jgi:hypothetical protein